MQDLEMFDAVLNNEKLSMVVLHTEGVNLGGPGMGF